METWQYAVIGAAVLLLVIALVMRKNKKAP
jgi:LPXTG-motif cell wall-anchored protein